jgi:mannosyltransferase
MAVASSGVSAIGRRLVSVRAGLAGGLLFAVLPEVSWYAQDARSYAIVTALAVAASYLLVRVLESGASTRWLTAYAACLAALGGGAAAGAAGQPADRARLRGTPADQLDQARGH